MVVIQPKIFSWQMAKFVMREVFPSFFMGTSIFLFIMLMFQAIRLSDFIIMHQVSPWNVMMLSFYLLLSFVPIALPVAFLFAVLIGISRANSEGEIIALQVSSFSIKQIFMPLLVFSFLITAVCVYTSLYSVPRGNRGFELMITKLSNERVMSALKPGVFFEHFFGLVLFAEDITPVRNEMRRLFIYDERDEEHPVAIVAEAGLMKRSPSGERLTMRLSNGSIYVDKKVAEGVQQKIDFDVYDINLDIDKAGEAWRDYSPPSLNYDQLKQRLKESEGDPPTHRRLEVELHRRFSLSFSCTVFAALGFFIGILSQKGLRSTAILVCLTVGVVYWLSYVAANAVALGGWLAPWIGIWIPNILFLFVPVLCYRRYRKGA